MLRGDVTEGEDATRDRTGRIPHHRLGERQPHVVICALDRDEPVGVAALRLEVPLQHLSGRAADGLRRRHARDLLGCAVPQHDVAVAVDGDDPVRDVREDRDALLPLEGDTLVQLGVRQRGGRVRCECDERLHFLFTPDARRPRIHGQNTVEPSVGSG